MTTEPPGLPYKLLQTLNFAAGIKICEVVGRSTLFARCFTDGTASWIELSPGIEHWQELELRTQVLK